MQPQIANTCRGQASVTRGILETLHFFFTPAPGGVSQLTRTRQRTWKKFCTKCSKMQQVFLSERPIIKLTSKKEN